MTYTRGRLKQEDVLKTELRRKKDWLRKSEEMCRISHLSWSVVLLQQERTLILVKLYIACVHLDGVKILALKHNSQLKSSIPFGPIANLRLAMESIVFDHCFSYNIH